MEKMTKTIAFMNQKGGVGKTTMTVHVSVGLAALGYRVVMVDMDPQGHIAMSFDVVGPDEVPEDGIFQLLVNDEPLSELLRPVKKEKYQLDDSDGTLEILPGRMKTQLVGQVMRMQGDFEMLATALAPLNGLADYVLIDTSPSVGDLTPAILAASQYVFIPTECERLAMDGVQNVYQVIYNLRKIHNAKPLGILPVKVRNTKEHKERLEELQGLYHDEVWDDLKMPLSTVWSEASDVAETIFRYVPNHEATNRAWQLVDRIIKLTGGE